jgi:hypothetical protein
MKLYEIRCAVLIRIDLISNKKRYFDSFNVK